MSKGETYLIRRSGAGEKPSELIRVPDELIIVGAGGARHPAEDVAIKATLRDLLFVLFRHAKKSLLFFAIVFGLAAAAAFVLPSSYKSSASLLVRLGRESMLPDPSVQIGKAVVAPIQNRNAEMNTELQILRSRELAEAVIAVIGPQRILAGAAAQPVDQLDPNAADVRSAILTIDRKLEVTLEPDSNVLAVSYEAKDPAVARDVVNAYVDQFRNVRSRIYRNAKTAEFFGNQETTIRNQIVELETEIRNLKDRTGVADLEDQRSVTISRLARIQTEIDAVQTALASTGAGPNHPGQARIRALQNQLRETESALQTINDVAVKLAALERDHGIKAETFKQYAAIAQQASIDKSMSDNALSSISVVQAASMPLVPSKPNRKLLLGVGLFLALSGAIGLAFVAEAVDHTIKRPEDLALMGVSRSVSIPLIEALAKSSGATKVEKLPAGHAPASKGVLQSRAGFASGPWAAVEAGAGESASTEIVPSAVDAGKPVSWFHDLRQGVRRLAEKVLTGSGVDGSNPRVIAMIGCRQGEGATTLACATAALFAERALLDAPPGSEFDAALLIDCDLHAPTLHKQLGVELSPGLTDWLADPASLNTPLEATVKPAPVDGLHVMPAGALRGGALTPNRLRRLLDVVAPNYRYVIVDLPPLAESPEAARLAAVCDGAVLVIEADQLRKQVALETLQTLREAGVHVLGAVLNKRDFPVPAWIYDRV